MAKDQVLLGKDDTANINTIYRRAPIVPFESRQIRLLAVMHQTSQGLLHCYLRPVRLDDLPCFIALSYTWGDEEADQEIFVNGFRFMVRRNLYAFLGTVATKNLRGVLLFIDAICIDQTNIAERESQIPHMRDIYSKASRVIAWLGSADGVSSERLANIDESLASINDRRLAALSTVSYGEKVLNSLQYMIDNLDKDVQGPTKGPPHGASTQKASNLLVDSRNPGGFSFSHERPFWTRVWIVQEIILAERLTIQFGEYTISPEDYLAGILRSTSSSISDVDTRAPDKRLQRRKNKSAKEVLLDREYLRGRLHHGPPIQLYEIILRFGSQQATEPLDLVFGFLGLAQTIVRADYQLTKIELYTYVFIEAAQHFSKPDLTWKDASVLQSVHYACLSVFGFSATDTTVAAITARALRLHSIPVLTRVHVALLSLFLERVDFPWDDLSQTQLHNRRLYRPIFLAQALWAVGRSFASYTRILISLQYLQILNGVMTAPEGEKGTYVTWMAYVRESYSWVRGGGPPRPWFLRRKAQNLRTV